MDPAKSLADVDTLAAEGRYDEAGSMLSALADGGDTAALFKLADWNYRGIGRQPDLEQARTLFAAAAEGGIEIAGHFVTNFMASGVGGPRDWPKAVERLEAEGRSVPLRRRTAELLRAMALTPDGEPAALPEEQKVSDSPAVSVFTELLSPAECGYLVSIAHPFFARSVVRDLATGLERPDPVRTNDFASLHSAIEDPAVHAINRRIAAATATRPEQGEPMQIFRYAPGQEFRRHMDADVKRANVRIKTVLTYLNDDYDGGETLFTRTGMFVRGGTGDAICFQNTLPSGEADIMSEHAGLPVKKGVKLLASRWICNEPYVPQPATEA